jgi:Na+/H+ antiporter NhaD/arsenite permease-like protein
VFFLGLFMVVGGAERAGLTEKLLHPVATWNLRRLPIFVAVTTLLSIVSSVPAVMLLRTLVSGFPDPHTGWLSLAMASTLAGNLTITGSVANIIVIERAAAEGGSCWLSRIPPRRFVGDRSHSGPRMPVVVAGVTRPGVANAVFPLSIKDK